MEVEISVLGLIAVFLGGLALNLTPCVYPMLSVTVAVFGRERQKPGSAFWDALSYVLGIAAMYSSLGVAAALTGEFFGAAIQSKFTLAFISALMLALAFGMFDLYELRMPSFILNRLGGRRRAGRIGLFVSGLFVGVFAAPCIGPPIVALLAFVGERAEPAIGFLVFFILSLGLGLPYLIFGTFSGLINKLPKSGEWLVWVKKIFGVILLGFALFYFALAFYAEALPFVVPGTLVLSAVYLGFWDRTGDQIAWFRRAKQVAGVIGLVIAFSLVSRKPVESVVWEPYDAVRLDEARKAGRPAIIEFYADWCLPCHELERYTYTDQRVIEALEPFARLKIDVTNPNSPEVQEPVERFGVYGVPTIIFLGPSGEEIEELRVPGYVPPEVFLEIVKRVPGSEGKEAGG